MEHEVGVSNNSSSRSEDAFVLLVKGLQEKVEKLESDSRKTLFKTISTSVGTTAAVLGLVVTFVTLYEAFVSKPDAERVARANRFNEAVNSVSKLRQEMTQSQFQNTDPNYQFTVAAMAMPRILNETFSARALLRHLDDNDITIPQLIVLISEAVTMYDLESARVYVERAVAKTDVSPYLRSEAKRHEARYFYVISDATRARRSYEEGLAALGDTPIMAGQRAYILGDFALLEMSYGECDKAISAFRRFLSTVNGPGVFPEQRVQLVAALKPRWSNETCALPEDLNTK